jgi:hypothetical protein
MNKLIISMLFLSLCSVAFAQQTITPSAPVETEFLKPDAYSHLYKSDTTFGDLYLGASFYNESSGLLNIFAYHPKEKNAFIIRFDPVNRKVIEQKLFTSLGYMEFFRISGLAISPNGRYLLLDKGGSKNRYSMYDLEKFYCSTIEKKKRSVALAVASISKVQV